LEILRVESVDVFGVVVESAWQAFPEKPRQFAVAYQSRLRISPCRVQNEHLLLPIRCTRRLSQRDFRERQDDRHERAAETKTQQENAIAACLLYGLHKACDS